MRWGIAPSFFFIFNDNITNLILKILYLIKNNVSFFDCQSFFDIICDIIKS